MSVSVERLLLVVLTGMQIATLGVVWSLWEFQTGMPLSEARQLAGYAVAAGIVLVGAPLLVAAVRDVRAHVGGEQ